MHPALSGDNYFSNEYDMQAPGELKTLMLHTVTLKTSNFSPSYFYSYGSSGYSIQYTMVETELRE